MKAFWIAVAALLGSAAASSVLAATVSCPGTIVTTDREFSLTTSPAATCLATGVGNLNGNGDAINALGFLTLDKSDDSVSGLLPNALSGGLTSGLSGSFSFFAPGYSSFVIAFKSGVGVLDPDWAAFLLPAGVTSGNWSISGKQALSHVNLYGIKDRVSQVPLPASGTLGLFLLGGIGLMMMRSRRTNIVA